MTSVNKNSDPNHEAPTLKPNFPMTDVCPAATYLEISPQYHSASVSRLLVSVMADGATFGLAGFAGRTEQTNYNHFKAEARCSDWTVPGGVMSCSVVLSVSSFSTTSPAKSSSKDVLREKGTIPSQG